MTENTSRPVVLIVIALLSFAAAGTAGALSLIERNSHAATSQNVTSARAKVDDVRARAKTAEAQADAEDKEFSELTLKLKQSELRRDGFRFCASQAREVTKRLLGQQAVVINSTTLGRC